MKMKSIKPGRGPSMMGGIGGIFVILIGIVWTMIAASIAPFMAIFGILFVTLAVIQTVYNFKNATSENRYSTYDITDSSEESDPLNDRFGSVQESTYQEVNGNFCPYCGARVEADYRFCNSCGRELPKK